MGTTGVWHAGSHHLILTMSIFQDQTYLVSNQYKDAINLTARIELHERFSSNPYGWFRWVFDQLDLPPVAHILEIGCGSGALWLDNQPRVREDWRITLSDFSPGMVSGIKHRLSSKPNQFRFGVFNAMALPFPDETFDAVIANHMLYHLPDRQRALVGIARVLKPAGSLYAATNGEKHMGELDSIIAQIYPSNNIGLLAGNRAKDFTLENGAEQLAPFFKEIDIRYYKDSLRVTEAEPLLAYILSMIPRTASEVDITEKSNIYMTIRTQIKQQGFIYIQKSSGVFICRK